VNRITSHALALALGLSLVSTVAFAADMSADQSASQIQSANHPPLGYVTSDGFQLGSGPTALPGPYRWQLEEGPFAQVGPYDRPSDYRGAS
jgi:hypothetical protein